MYRKTWADHIFHLQTVLQILSDNSLFVEQSMCCFGVLQVECLGHLISLAGVAVDPKKIQSILKWPVPTSTKGVRGFLRLAGYYSKFIGGFGGITAPFTRLLTNEGFYWTSEAESAFTQLKQALTSPPVLRLPDFSHPFVIECDAYHNMIN